MVTISDVQEIMARSFPQDFVRLGEVSPVEGHVRFKGRDIPAQFLVVDKPQAGDKCLMVHIDNVWWVFAVKSKPKPVAVHLWHKNGIIFNGAGYVRIEGADFDYFEIYQQASGQGSGAIQYVYLVEGMYMFQTIGHRNPDRGIVSWWLNNVLLANHDWYNATSTPHHIINTSISVPYTGYHELKYQVNSRHASSTNFTLALTYYLFLPI